MCGLATTIDHIWNRPLWGFSWFFVVPVVVCGLELMVAVLCSQGSVRSLLTGTRSLKKILEEAGSLLRGFWKETLPNETFSQQSTKVRIHARQHTNTHKHTHLHTFVAYVA